MRDVPYTGPTKNLLSLAEARALGPRWVVQEKVDGMFVRVCLNSQGRVGQVFSRSETPVGRDLLNGILGAHLGQPHAELTGELEAFAERSQRAIAGRGQPLVHLFDCLHDGTRSLADEPYHVRRDALYRMQSAAECAETKKPGRKRAADGRYALERLTGWRVAPIVEQAPLRQLGDVWERIVKEGDGEGLVLVNLDAKAGARASKLKLKPWETVDCVVHQVGGRYMTCLWNGHAFVVHRGRHHVEPGNVVEVRHAGWYEHRVLPKTPVFVRVRRELLI